jgi:integrase
MKGHIRERSPGRWAIILDVRDPETGRRKRKWHSFAGTKREAQNECARLITTMQSGSYIEPSKTKLAEFLDHWLCHIRSQVAPRTFERYTEIARKNLAPAIGSAVLTKLRPEQISAAYTNALVTGRRNGSGGLSPRTVHHMHRILRQALDQAVRWNLLVRNPADAVKPPKVERTPMQAYDLVETAAVIEAARHSRMMVPTLLAVLCGLRRGEILALRWRHVDLELGQIGIVQSLEQTSGGLRFKETKSGRARTVALSATVTAELLAHRARQAQELLRLGIRLSPNTLVAARADGEPMQPRSLTHEWQKLTKRRGLRPVRFHDLRHAHATHLLASGVHPKIASERLGHSSVGVTLDLYSHVTRGMQEDAAALVDAALQSAIKRRAEGVG